MRAVTIADGEVSFAEQPEPVPSRGEVLVRVDSAGINGADMLQRRGVYPAPPGEPADIPGLELAGVVAKVGRDVRRFGVGDRVMGIVGGGGQAEFAVVHERQLMPVPETLGRVEAGGFPEVFTTAHDALFTQADLRPGDRLLVHGAAGGVGTAAIQLGRSVGAFVVATSRHAQFDDELAALGADIVTRPEEHLAHGPFDVVLELVGAPNMVGDIKALATGGRIVVIGVGAGVKAEINLLALMAARAKIMGSTLRSRPLEEKAATARAVEREVLPLVQRGAVTVPLANTFPAEQCAEAYDFFKAGGKLGKVVLTF